MAIALVGTVVGANAASVTPPTGNIGDLMIVHAFRNGSATAPSLPAGWTNIDNTGSTSTAFRVGYKYATATGDSSGTWTNASTVILARFTGMALANPVGTPVHNSGTGTAITYGALTITQSATSWQLSYFGGGSATALTTRSGFTRDLAQGSAPLAVMEHITNPAGSSDSATATGSGNWITCQVELLANLGLPGSGVIRPAGRVRAARPARGRLAPAVPVQDQAPAPPPSARPRPRPPAARRARPLAPVPTQAAPVAPVYPPAAVVAPRRLRGALPRRGRTVTPVPPQVNPPYPWAEVVQPRRVRGLLPRRGRQAWPVSGQDAPVVETVQPRRLRGLLPRRGRSFTVVPPQFNPPYVWQVLTQPRRLRGLLPRRGRAVPPTPPQDTPLAEATQPRRLRGLLPRHGRQATVVPPQFNPPFLFPEIVQARRLRGWPVRRGRHVTPVPPQFNPPFPVTVVAQPRRIRGLLARKARPVETVPTQVVVTPGTWLPQPPRARIKPVWPRRRTTAAVPLAADGPPAPASQPRRVRGLLARRGRVTNPVPPQFNPSIVPPVISQARRVRGWLQRRGRQFTATPAQGAPLVEVPSPRRAHGWLMRRGKTATVVPAQVNPPYPTVSVHQPRRTRGLPARRGRAVTPAPAQAGPVTETGQPRRVRGWLSRRPRRTETVPPQVTVIPPAWLPQPRGKRHLWLPWWRPRTNPQPVRTITPTRDIAVTFGPLSTRWQFGTPVASPWNLGQPTVRWTLGTQVDSGWTLGTLGLRWQMGAVMLSIAATSTEYLRTGPVEILVAGQAYDPTGDLVEFAFMPGTTQPAAPDWHAGAWEPTTVVGDYFARCLVGPGAGGVPLAAGVYAVWCRVTDNPEIPVRQVGSLKVY